MIKTALIIYVTWFVACVCILEILIYRTEKADKYVKRITKPGKQVVEYRFVLGKVLDLDRGVISLELLTNKQHPFDPEAMLNPIKVQATADQIKAIKSRQSHQILADLEVIIDTGHDKLQVKTELKQITKYI
ncbi:MULTISPECIES: hypothetical protein [Lactobacillus]|uniref:Uncharacterized protein n=1 Tax=Lactobacillus xujianguonis TaxID=2495899 RepID=A0A437SW97_9LACO|nr:MULTISPECIES: hypothetical protein [Lactobacillus]RVU71208.1 hypothetical protein EJK17_03145 [Lactobacillus xujianguonis]